MLQDILISRAKLIFSSIYIKYSAAAKPQGTCLQGRNLNVISGFFSPILLLHFLLSLFLSPIGVAGGAVAAVVPQDPPPQKMGAEFRGKLEVHPRGQECTPEEAKSDICYLVGVRCLIPV